MSKKKQKMVEWQEEQKPAEPMARKEMEKAITKRKPKFVIKSSHRGGTT